MNDLSLLDLKYLTIKAKLPGKVPTQYVCKCICNRTIVVEAYKLKRKRDQSCGCIQKDRFKELSQIKKVRESRIYKLWNHIKNSCRNPNCVSYLKHGARGITMSDEWFNSFELFSQEVGEYKEGFSLALIDISKGYSSGNCKWIIKCYY